MPGQFPARNVSQALIDQPDLRLRREPEEIVHDVTPNGIDAHELALETLTGSVVGIDLIISCNDAAEYVKRS